MSKANLKSDIISGPHSIFLLIITITIIVITVTIIY
jgi:hypothetical protein